uniref:Uncharacterized protein n=1 Tax=Cacopsylla melanoneura TaxID=428564 RepID=A0A8D8ZEV6_9HEMI
MVLNSTRSIRRNFDLQVFTFLYELPTYFYMNYFKNILRHHVYLSILVDVCNVCLCIYYLCTYVCRIPPAVRIVFKTPCILLTYLLYVPEPSNLSNDMLPKSCYLHRSFVCSY